MWLKKLFSQIWILEISVQSLPRSSSWKKVSLWNPLVWSSHSLCQAEIYIQFLKSFGKRKVGLYLEWTSIFSKYPQPLSLLPLGRSIVSSCKLWAIYLYLHLPWSMFWAINILMWLLQLCPLKFIAILFTDSPKVPHDNLLSLDSPKAKQNKIYLGKCRWL